MLEFDVKKYHKDSNLFVCPQCFQQLTKYERAAQKLREIKQELLTAFRNREQLREKRLACDENCRDNPETINNGDVRVSAVKNLWFSTETSHVYSDPAACTSYTTCPLLAQSTPVPSSRQAFLFTEISPIQTKNIAFFDSQGDVHGNIHNVWKDFHLSKPGCSDSTIVKLHVHYPSRNLNKTLVGSYQTLGKVLAHGVPSQIAKAVMNCPTVRIHVVSSVIKAVSREVSGLCGKSRLSLLRKTSIRKICRILIFKSCVKNGKKERQYFTRSC